VLLTKASRPKVRIQRRPAWKCDSAIMRQLKSQMDESSESPTNIHCDPFGEPNLVPHRDYAIFLASPTGSDSLKAVVITRYGPPVDVLQLREVATPEPAEDEILIRLHASSVNPLDGFTIRGPLSFSPKLGRLLKAKHKIPGADFAGRVESVGGAIKRFRTGDEVFGASFTGKGLGGFAEFACAGEDSLAPKPSNLSFEEAAAVPVAAITAFRAFAIRVRSSAARRFRSMARLAVWVLSLSRLPNHSGLK
jgi:hypothetical protein